MDATRQGFRCNWAGCPKEFDSERNWLKHVAVHVFTLKPNERTPWLGPPEVDPGEFLARLYMVAEQNAIYILLQTTGRIVRTKKKESFPK